MLNKKRFNTMRPLISTIVPTYNGEDTIVSALRTIVGQVGRGHSFDIKIIMVDDGSTDLTVDLAREYLRSTGIEFDIISYPENSGGPNRGRNRGLDEATGDYVAMLDQDDKWVLDKTITQLSAIRGYHLAYSQYVGQEKPPSDDPYSDLSNWIKNTGLPHGCSILVRNENLPRYETRYGFLDYEFMLSLTKDRRCIQTKPVAIKGSGNHLSLNSEYRRVDFHVNLMVADGNLKAMGRMFSTRAKFLYFAGEMAEARWYFIRGTWTLVHAVYFLSSYSRWASNYIRNKMKWLQ